MPTVASLLAESRAAHSLYRQLLPRMQAVAGTVQEMLGNVMAAKDALERAGTLRKAAHDADPEHTDPAWAADPAPHDELMTFYAERLAAMEAV